MEEDMKTDVSKCIQKLRKENLRLTKMVRKLQAENRDLRRCLK